MPVGMAFFIVFVSRLFCIVKLCSNWTAMFNSMIMRFTDHTMPGFGEGNFVDVQSGFDVWHVLYKVEFANVLRRWNHQPLLISGTP